MYQYLKGSCKQVQHNLAKEQYNINRYNHYFKDWGKTTIRQSEKQG